MEGNLQARQIAYIVNVKDVLEGIYMKEDNWNPNHIKIGNKNVSRVNIIGVIIDSSESGTQDMIIDDGTGKIVIRNFDKRIHANVGDVVHVVGKVRQYGNERYIVPEMLKNSIDAKWNFIWRKLALKKDMLKDNSSEKIVISADSDSLDIIEKIRELDDGDGVSYEEVSKQLADKGLISDLLMKGEIYEIRPGKLKVLD